MSHSLPLGVILGLYWDNGKAKTTNMLQLSHANNQEIACPTCSAENACRALEVMEKKMETTLIYHNVLLYIANISHYNVVYGFRV